MNDDKAREWWIQFTENIQLETFVHDKPLDTDNGKVIHVIEYAGTVEMRIGEHIVSVDSEMVHFLQRFTWYIKTDKNTHYAMTSVKIGGKNHALSMHRLLTGMVTGQIDHINNNGLDNRKVNLRYATNQQNSCNRVRNNRHGFRGVTHDHNNGWRCQISVNGKRYGKAGFKTAEEAARAYDELSKEHHGEFGIRNFKD